MFHHFIHCEPPKKNTRKTHKKQPNKFQQYAKTLHDYGFVVIPREVIGIQITEVEEMYREQLLAANKILGLQWNDAEHVHTMQQTQKKEMQQTQKKEMQQTQKKENERKGKKDTTYKKWLKREYKQKLPIGLLDDKLLHSQLKLQLDWRINSLYDYLFTQMGIVQDSPINYIHLQKTNLTLPGGNDDKNLRKLYQQKGADEHVDENPWNEQDPDEEFDYDFWGSGKKKRIDKNHMRPRERYRPIASFIALTDCIGGPNNGGMGFSPDRSAYGFLQDHQIRGRNKKCGQGTFIRKTVTGAKGDYKKMLEKRQKAIVKGMIYPEYNRGDVVLWLYNTVHSGPRNNVHHTQIQSRMYIGLIPDCRLNRQHVQIQWAKYGKDIEKIADITEEEKRRFGKNIRHTATGTTTTT